MSHSSCNHQSSQNYYLKLYNNKVKDIVQTDLLWLRQCFFWHHQVCEDTASWLSRALDKDASYLEMTRAEVLETLVQSSSIHSTVQYDPSEWYQQALDVVKIVADDRYGIHQALGGTAALKDILTKLAETAISKLVTSAGASR